MSTRSKTRELDQKFVSGDFFWKENQLKVNAVSFYRSYLVILRWTPFLNQQELKISYGMRE